MNPRTDQIHQVPVAQQPPGFVRVPARPQKRPRNGLGGEFGVTHRAGTSLLKSAVVATFTLCAAGQLKAENLGFIETGGALILPLDVSGLSGEMAIEIDNIDVTDFVTIVDGQLVIASNAPLAGGVHEITVYLFDGAIYDVIATYSFSTEDATATGSNSLSYSIEANHEAGVQDINGKSQTFATSSGAATIESEDGALNGRIGYLASSRDEERINGNSVDLAEYYLEYTRYGGALNVTGRIGHQTLSYDNALVGDVSKRGASVVFSRPDERFSFGFFGVRSSDDLGYQNVSGLSEENNRMFGAQVAWRPFALSDFRISLQAYEGRGTPNGGLETGFGGGYSVSVDGTARDGRLRYGAVYGRTKWDEDGHNAIFVEETGETILSYLEYDVLGADGGSKNLTLGVAYERSDFTYFSLANPGVAVGGETFRFTADYSADRLGLSFYADTQKTNVGGDPSWPTDRVSLLSLDGNYDLSRDNGFWQNTSLRFGASLNWQDRLTTPGGAPEPEDFSSIGFYLGLDRYTDTSSWSVDYTYLDDDDKSVFNYDSTSHMLTVAFDYIVSDRLALNGSGSYTNAETNGVKWQRSEAVVGMRYDIAPAEWFLQFDAGLTDTNEPFALDGSFVTAELAWAFVPAVELALSASYRDGSYGGESGEGHDAIVGLFLRANTSIFR